MRMLAETSKQPLENITNSWSRNGSSAHVVNRYNKMSLLRPLEIETAGGVASSESVPIYLRIVFFARKPVLRYVIMFSLLNNSNRSLGKYSIYQNK